MYFIYIFTRNIYFFVKKKSNININEFIFFFLRLIRLLTQNSKFVKKKIVLILMESIKINIMQCILYGLISFYQFSFP